ncbi:MAG TPA: BrnT family toxin [Acidobacteriaceae bacterium]|nr:BrnT family toxin [Acidobacteriaceae bacterium]
MFDWNEANIAHIAEHGVTPQEAEEVITNSPLDIDYAERNGEIRIRQVGETAARRYLVVISTLRSGKTRVVTSYPPSRSLQATYLNYRGYVKDGKESPS